MTPDEMKVLARVANRNVNEESPIVIDNSSRVVSVESLDAQPLSLEEKVDKLMANLAEVQKASQPNNDNSYSTILGDLADQVEQNRIAISSVKNTIDTLPVNNNFDELNLSAVDVLLNVKSTYKKNRKIFCCSFRRSCL